MGDSSVISAKHLVFPARHILSDRGFSMTLAGCPNLVDAPRFSVNKLDVEYGVVELYYNLPCLRTIQLDFTGDFHVPGKDSNVKVFYD